MINEPPQSSLTLIQDILTDAIRFWEKRRVGYTAQGMEFVSR